MKMINIKVLIPILFFIVTWNEYHVVLVNNPDPNYTTKEGGRTSMAWVPLEEHEVRYEVHLATRTMRFNRQIDVDRFIGEPMKEGLDETGWPILILPVNGIISSNAFNIKVEEIKEDE